jgi:hypothetical protein
MSRKIMVVYGHETTKEDFVPEIKTFSTVLPQNST